MDINSKYWLEGDLKPAFAYAKEIIDFHAKSFAFASGFIPENRRWATYAVYLFCRFADNIVDKPRKRNLDLVLKEIDSLQKELDLAYQFGESEHPVLKSFIVAAKLFDIPQEYANEFIEGVKMDLTIERYETFDELYVFCYRVASVVGLMMTYVLGFTDKSALIYAEKMGIAMQLTNILRDIKEDKELGRIYIPLNELQQFDITENDFFDENLSVKFKKMMEFQVERAKSYYKECTKGISLLNQESQFAIYAAGRIYSDILRKIEEIGYNPFLGRVFVPKIEKISILMKEYVKRNILRN